MGQSLAMKRYSAPPTVYQDPSRPPNDDESDSTLSDGSKKVKTAQSFESLFNSESLSDIILDINGGQFLFHAHKMIVGLKSERLAALITSVVSPVLDNNNSNNHSSTRSNITQFTSSTIDRHKGLSNSLHDKYNSIQDNKYDNILNNNSNGSSINNSNKPVLFLHESPECAAVFSRFLYFIYSGSVWLHRDYVISLFQLSLKYGVAALASHCENYVLQLLKKSQNTIQTSLTGITPCLSIVTVCELCEGQGYREETRRAALSLLARRFAELSCHERWAECRWGTVRELLRSDKCSCDENLILAAATGWMKLNKLQDRSQIQEILASIRYPRLPRRVLYHLHTTASFKNFPQVQKLIEAAIHYHCFKDVPEAQSDFSGLQYRARGNSRSTGRHSRTPDDTQTATPDAPIESPDMRQSVPLCADGEVHEQFDSTHPKAHGFCLEFDQGDQNNSSEEGIDDDSSPEPQSHHTLFREESPPPPPPNEPLPPVCRAHRHNHNQHSHHHHHHRNHRHRNRSVQPRIPDCPLSSFHPKTSTCSPVAAVSPRIQSRCRSSSPHDSATAEFRSEVRSSSPHISLQHNVHPHSQWL